MFPRFVLRALVASLRWIRPHYYCWRGHLAGFTRNQSYIVKTMECADPCRGSDSAAVICHYDSRGMVHDYLRYYLECLRDADFRIHFVCNAPRLSEEALEKLIPLCTKVIHRKNVGHDFGAYKDGILSIPDRSQLARLLITNDSMYGPFQPLANCLDAMIPEEADVWGLTDSYEIRYHLQSYFVLFHNAALRHESFDRFWREMPYVSAKGWVVHQGEVGLTQRLASSGLRFRSLFAYEAILAKFRAALEDSRALAREDIRPLHRDWLAHILDAADIGIPLNPSHFFWDLLIGQMGYPFIKRDLLEKNPARILGVAQWREIIGANSKYDLELIARHQKMRVKYRSI